TASAPAATTARVAPPIAADSPEICRSCGRLYHLVPEIQEIAEVNHGTSCVRRRLSGGHPCPSKEKGHGEVCGCGPTLGGVQTQCVPCGGYTKKGRLSAHGWRSLPAPD